MALRTARIVREGESFRLELGEDFRIDSGNNVSTSPPAPIRYGAFVLWLGMSAAAEAGPWAAGRGHFYAKVGGSRLHSTTLAAPDGTRFEIPRFTKDEISLYGAAGLTDRVTGILSLPAYRSSDLAELGQSPGRFRQWRSLSGPA